MKKNIKRKITKVTALALATTIALQPVVPYGATWQKNNVGWWYAEDNNSYATGWRFINNHWYYFDSSGYMKTGWQFINGSWYFMDSSGAMATGWKYINKHWYYFNGSGAMQTGWEYIDGHWFYMEPSGAMVTGWKYINKNWFYMNGSGYMLTGWQYINGNWFYMNDSGYMLTGWQFINSNWFYMNGSGVMKTGWQYLGGHWFYMNGSGVMKTGWQFINNHWYYFNGSGYMQTGWKYINGNWFYMESSGAMITGWKWINGNCYYFYKDGHMASNEITPDGFYVDANGKWTDKPEEIECNHSYKETITKEPTCTENGEKLFVCTKCNDSYKEVIPATGHDYGEWIVDKEPTETKEGHRYKECKNCGHKIEESISKLDHKHKVTFVKGKAATCTEDGMKDYYYCNICNKKFSNKQCKNEVTDKDLVIKTTGHDYGEWVVDKKPTETSEGHRYKKCKNCNHMIEESIPSLNHEHKATFVNGKAATCTEDGMKDYYFCEGCGKKFSDNQCKHEINDKDLIIKATGHNYEEKVTKEATCTKEGVITVKCTKCSHSYTKSIPATGHNYGEWIVDKKPTENAEGHRYKQCTKCGHKIEESISKLNHEHKAKLVKGKTATCTEDGMKDYYYCNGCGKKFSDSQCKYEVTDKDLVIKATGHNYGEWVVDKKPTENAEGHRYKECKNCGHKIEESIPSLKHEHKAKLVKGKVATCTEDGTKDYYYCEGCGKKFSDSQCKHEVTDKDLVIKATGHNYSSKITKAPTCSVNGVRTYTCDKCGHSYTEVIPATENHDYQPVYKTIHHEEEGHYETIHHEEKGHYEMIYHEEKGHYEIIHHEEKGHYETIHHEEKGHWEMVYHDEEGHWENQMVSEAYDEDVYEIHDICNICYQKYIKEGYTKEEAEHKADLTAKGEAPDDHAKKHAMAGEGSGSHSTGRVKVGVIHHDAVYEDVWVVDKEAYSEKVWIVDEKAYDEKKWIIDQVAYDEEVWVVDEEAYNEKVWIVDEKAYDEKIWIVDREAYDEQVIDHYECIHCGHHK